MGFLIMFFLVCFDISNDRIRYQVVKVLISYGQRVQKSVFECGDLSEERFLKMKNSIDDLIDQGEDTVRYYLLCRGCLRKIEYSGTGELPDGESFKVV
jgi:CRISPR-associated protein Cas2